MNELYKQMTEFVDSKAEWMKANRRDFHKYAESAWHEVRTCSKIMDYLLNTAGIPRECIIAGKDCFVAEDRMGLPDQDELDTVYERALEQGAVKEYAPLFKDGFTGIEVVIDTNRPGKTFGFRVDIDALGVNESHDDSHRPAREGFASINIGEMHACGHDGHATMGMVAVETIWKFKDQLCGKFKFVFQPAEEGVRGAHGMIGTGFFDDIDYMMGIHLYPLNENEPEEAFFFQYKDCMANSKIDVEITGKAAHAGQAQNGNSAMLAAIQMISNTYAIPRASLGDTRINVGQITAGTGRNVVCDRAKIIMEIRGLTQAALDYLSDYTKRIVEHASAMHGCTATLKYQGATPCVAMDSKDFTDELVELSNNMGMKALPAHYGDFSDDYAYMADAVTKHGGKSCYVLCRAEESAPHHAVTFDFNESYLPRPIKLFLAAALKYSGSASL